MSASEAQVLRAGAGEARSEAGAWKRPPDCLTAAFQLGWRIAGLYAQVTDPGEPSGDAAAKAIRASSRGPARVAAAPAAGAARRAGIASRADALER